MSGERRSEPSFGVRLAWLGVLAAHVAGAVLALRFLPQGFPPFHSRSILGTLAPAGVVAVSLVLAAALVLAPRTSRCFLPALPAFWGSAALTLLALFPVTGAAAARPLGAVALVLAILASLACRYDAWLEWLPALVAGAISGVLVARCERPAAPSTQPLFRTVSREDAAGEPVSGRLELGPDLSVDSATFELSWRGQRTAIAVAPALEFSRTSPDGFWSIFAPAAGRSPRVSMLARTADSLRLSTTDGAQRLNVSGKGDGVSLEAWTLLTQPLYSHLNSFTTVRVSGHQRLGLRFSPCPDSVVAVTHADYPRGAPARFAYVDAARRFHVVQAADAEKGPFTSLAEGSLPAAATLVVDLLDLGEDGRPLATLALSDFAGQLSTALSPTAGYGVAENAVEFGLAEPASNSAAHLVFALAASGVGRGWDSVGHRAGAYLNRVEVRLFDAPRPPEPAAQLDAASLGACVAIARDIARLKPRFGQLAAFDPAAVAVGPGECTLAYAYHTHRSTLRAGWRAQVPEPDPDGIWFHVGVWDPKGPARSAQINTQPGFAVYALGDDNVTVLLLEGANSRALGAELWSLLRRHGVGALRR